MNALGRLMESLDSTSDVYVNAGVDEASHFQGLRESILASLCEPQLVRAVVMPPGFPGLAIGDSIEGVCLAQSQGYWLVYRELDDQFYCFWGTSADKLGAHGVFGSPLYCWSA
jgi:hypothetical protein